MDKEVWLGLIVIAAFVIIVFGGLVYALQKTSKYYTLTDYSCEQIDEAIRGNCLIKYKNFAKGRCYNANELYVYYKLKCQEMNKTKS